MHTGNQLNIPSEQNNIRPQRRKSFFFRKEDQFQDFVQTLRLQTTLSSLMIDRVRSMVEDYFKLLPQHKKSQKEAYTLLQYNNRLIQTIDKFRQHEKKILDRLHRLEQINIKYIKEVCALKNKEFNKQDIKSIQSIMENFNINQWKFQPQVEVIKEVPMSCEQKLLKITRRYVVPFKKQDLDKIQSQLAIQQLAHEHELANPRRNWLNTLKQKTVAYETELQKGISMNNVFDLFQLRKDIEDSIQEIDMMSQKTPRMSSEQILFVREIRKFYADITSMPEKDFIQILKDQKQIQKKLQQQKLHVIQTYETLFETLVDQRNTQEEKNRYLSNRIQEYQKQLGQARKKLIKLTSDLETRQIKTNIIRRMNSITNNASIIQEQTSPFEDENRKLRKLKEVYEKDLQNVREQCEEFKRQIIRLKDQIAQKNQRLSMREIQIEKVYIDIPVPIFITNDLIVSSHTLRKNNVDKKSSMQLERQFVQADLLKRSSLPMFNYNQSSQDNQKYFTNSNKFDRKQILKSEENFDQQNKSNTKKGSQLEPMDQLQQEAQIAIDNTKKRNKRQSKEAQQKVQHLYPELAFKNDKKTKNLLMGINPGLKKGQPFHSEKLLPVDIEEQEENQHITQMPKKTEKQIIKQQKGKKLTSQDFKETPIQLKNAKNQHYSFKNEKLNKQNLSAETQEKASKLNNKQQQQNKFRNPKVHNKQQQPRQLENPPQLFDPKNLSTKKSPSKGKLNQQQQQNKMHKASANQQSKLPQPESSNPFAMFNAFLGGGTSQSANEQIKQEKSQMQKLPQIKVNKPNQTNKANKNLTQHQMTESQSTYFNWNNLSQQEKKQLLKQSKQSQKKIKNDQIEKQKRQKQQKNRNKQEKQPGSQAINAGSNQKKQGKFIQESEIKQRDGNNLKMKSPFHKKQSQRQNIIRLDTFQSNVQSDHMQSPKSMNTRKILQMMMIQASLTSKKSVNTVQLPQPQLTSQVAAIQVQLNQVKEKASRQSQVQSPQKKKIKNVKDVAKQFTQNLKKKLQVNGIKFPNQIQVKIRQVFVEIVPEERKVYEDITKNLQQAKNRCQQNSHKVMNILEKYAQILLRKDREVSHLERMMTMFSSESIELQKKFNELQNRFQRAVEIILISHRAIRKVFDALLECAKKKPEEIINLVSEKIRTVKRVIKESTLDKDKRNQKSQHRNSNNGLSNRSSDNQNSGREGELILQDRIIQPKSQDQDNKQEQQKNKSSWLRDKIQINYQPYQSFLPEINMNYLLTDIPTTLNADYLEQFKSRYYSTKQYLEQNKDTDQQQLYIKYKQALKCMEQQQRKIKAYELQYQNFINEITEDETINSQVAMKDQIFYLKKQIKRLQQVRQEAEQQYEKVMKVQIIESRKVTELLLASLRQHVDVDKEF